MAHSGRSAGASRRGIEPLTRCDLAPWGDRWAPHEYAPGVSDDLSSRPSGQPPPLVLDDAPRRFGPAGGVAEGSADGAGKSFVADKLGGVRQIPVEDPASASYFAVFVALNGGGSPGVPTRM
jgi:hypothetical protein